MQTKNVYYVQWNICIYIYMLLYIQKNHLQGPRVFTDNSNCSFTDINPEIKKDHICIKTIFTIKAATKDDPSPHISSEKHANSETCVEHK